MSDGTNTYDGDDAMRIIEAMNQQAREVLIFPPIACNLIVTKKTITIVVEFQRMHGSAMDATIVQLNFEQARLIQDFLNHELGEMTELALLRRMKEPTKENRDDTEEGSIPPSGR